MNRRREPGFEARKGLCKRAICGDREALSKLTDWALAVFDRVTSGDVAARREFEELAYAVAYDFVEERIRLSFPYLRGRHSVSSGLHMAYLRLGNTQGLFCEPDAFASDLSSFCRRLCYMAHYALLDLVNRQRDWDGRHLPTRTEGGESLQSAVEEAQAGSDWDPVLMAQWSELHERVERLPKPLRNVFTRHYYLGMTQSEIAERTGLHPKQISRMWAQSVALLGDLVDPKV